MTAAVTILFDGLAYAALLFIVSVGLSIAGGSSVPIKRLVYRPLYDKDELDQVLLTIGLVFTATAVITFAYGPAPPAISVPAFLTGQVDIGFRTVPANRLFTIVFGIVLIATLWLGLERTLE